LQPFKIKGGKKRRRNRDGETETKRVRKEEIKRGRGNNIKKPYQ